MPTPITVNNNQGIGTTFVHGQKHKFRIQGTNFDKVSTVTILETVPTAMGNFEWDTTSFTIGDAKTAGQFSLIGTTEIQFFSKIVKSKKAPVIADGDGDGLLTFTLAPIDATANSSPTPLPSMPSNYSDPTSLSPPSPTPDDGQAITSSSGKVITINIW
jgi:hypothetical protein